MLVLAPLSAWPQTPDATLGEVVVSAGRGEQRAFDAPASVQAIGSDVVRDAGPMVNLSESINRIPGVAALDRQNYSQDLQVSIRGFGARSTFGIRGLRVLVDGIPATTPDGQGQASTISLGSVERIEVLRGPLAQLYGNAAGGVIQVFTRRGPPVPYAQSTFTAGSYGLRRWDLLTGGQADNGAVDYTLEYSDLSADGYRDHSAVRRRTLNTRWGFALTEHDSLTLTAQGFDQPTAQDPQGLTRAQAAADPRQSIPSSYTQNTGKAVTQTQFGALYTHAFDSTQRVEVRAYGGQRMLYNWLGTPLVNQLPVTSAGGIVDLGRDFGGAGIVYRREDPLWGGRLATVVGTDVDASREARKGFLNVNGVQGALKRDEIDRVTAAGVFGQADWLINGDWTLTGGVRASRVTFTSDDDFVTPGNPDDSGARRYTAVSPVLGLTRHFGDLLNIYLNWGRGFETPSLTELAYRNGASGLNLGLQASRSRQWELGTKWRPRPGQSLDAAVYSIHSDNELTVDSNVGGRTVYRNGGPSQRTGLELSYTGALSTTVAARAALTYMRAVFDDGSGRRIPGVSGRYVFAEVAWRPRPAGPSDFWGFAPEFALEAYYSGRIYVDDGNSDSTSPYTVFNLRGSLQRRFGQTTVRALARINNLAARSYVGSVIVNESNQRFFEPAPGRTAIAGVTVEYAWQ